MIVVSDTTPLISLMKADSLDLLKTLFGEVLIPTAVFEELVSNKMFPDEARQIRESTFIKVVDVGERMAVDVLRRATGLDLGESEAIIYADAVKAETVLMDEIKGRRIAKSMGLTIMGTIGILLFAYDNGCVTKVEVETALDKLKHSGRFIGEDLIRYAVSKL